MILYLLAFILYFLFNVFLYFLPVLIPGAVILAQPWRACRFYEGLNG